MLVCSQAYASTPFFAQTVVAPIQIREGRPMRTMLIIWLGGLNQSDRFKMGTEAQATLALTMELGTQKS